MTLPSCHVVDFRVQVASVDDEGTYVGYGEEADDDISTCDADSSLPPPLRARNRRSDHSNHSSRCAGGGGDNSDLNGDGDGDGDGDYFLWAEDGAEELVREDGNGGRWSDDVHSPAGSAARPVASRFSPPALRPVRPPYHSLTDELGGAWGSYAYRKTAMHFSTDKLSALAGSEGHTQTEHHGDFMRGYSGQQDQYGSKPASKVPHRRGCTSKHHAERQHAGGEQIHAESTALDESSGARGHGISGKKRNRSSGSSTTNSSQATGKRKR
jgi:hypothetical protein